MTTVCYIYPGQLLQIFLAWIQCIVHVRTVVSAIYKVLYRCVRPTRRIGVVSDFVMEKVSHACVVNCVRLNSVTVVF